MLIETNVLKARHKDFWPKLRKRNMWADQRQYYVPDLDDAKAMVDTHSVRGIPFRNVTMECESYELFLRAAIKRSLSREAEGFYRDGKEPPDRLKYTWAIGSVRILHPKHLLFYEGSHKMNTIFTKSGLFLVEPTTDEFITPGVSRRPRDGDFVYYLNL